MKAKENGKHGQNVTWKHKKFLKLQDLYRCEVREAGSVRPIIAYTAQSYGTHLLKTRSQNL